MLPRFEGRSALRTFLFGIALNLCRRQERSAARAARALGQHEDAIREELHADLAAADPVRDRRERIRALEAALAAMDARDAWLLRARLVSELGYGEILPRYQARFGGGITTVEGLRTAFFHARRRLQASLRGSEP